MQVDATAALASQLQTLKAAAANQYDASQGFNVKVDTSDDDPQTGAAAGAGYQLSGSFQSTSLVAVGSVSAGGEVTLFPQAQIQGEEADVAQMRQASYADSLSNFMTLVQAGATNGQASASSYSDQQQFTTDNGLISMGADISLSLTPTTSESGQTA